MAESCIQADAAGEFPLGLEVMAAREVARYGRILGRSSRPMPGPSMANSCLRHAMLGAMIAVWAAGCEGPTYLDLSHTTTDVDLAEHLKGRTNILTVNLSGAPVTDAGLVHLKSQTRLRALFLNLTQVSDAGLVHLNGLPSLMFLHLYGTQISDAGLVHLKGLTNLERLDLRKTQVTDVGVKELNEALPNCHIRSDSTPDEDWPGPKPLRFRD